MSKITRRDALKVLAGAGAGALSGCDPGPRAVELVPAGWDRGEWRSIATSCGQCQACCGIRVNVHEGRAVKIEGHPDHPVNRGGIGPKGQAGLQLLYHPDRVPGPLRRKGPRGTNALEPITWEAAIELLAGRLRELRDAGDAHGLVVIDGEPRGPVRELWDRFLEAFGSPNHLTHESTSFGGKVLAMLHMHGAATLPAYDWEHANYVVGFGAMLFESWCQTIHLMRASSGMRRGKPGQRVKFVQVSPMFSTTAVKADEWVPIEPGTYGALALGLAHVLVAKDLFDRAFVAAHTFGFEDWTDDAGRAHRGYRRLVLEDYPPQRVEKLTGVPAAHIERLAREMASHRPAIALADGGAAAATNGLGTAMAIHALNALLGNLERPGGMLVPPRAPLAPWKPVEPDAAARAGRSRPRIDGAGTPAFPLGRGVVQAFPRAALAGDPYPVRALFLHRSNPVFSKPAGADWIAALSKIPLVVSFSPLADESTFWADLVLPDHTYLEREELVEPAPSVGRPVVGWRQPVVTPCLDTRATADVLIALARTLGGPIGAALPWRDMRAAVEERLAGLVGQPGSITAKDVPELVEKIAADGGWWGPTSERERWKEAFATPSGKFEFFSQSIRAKLAGLFPDEQALARHLEQRGVATRGDDLCLPHWEPPVFAGEPARFPFIVLAHRGIEYAEGGARHLPWTRELPRGGMLAWREFVELNPDDARKLAIVEGEEVTVETPAGTRRLTARILPGIRPGTIGLPLGHGDWPPAPGASTAGGYGLLANASDPLAGIFALQGTRARVTRDGR